MYSKNPRYRIYLSAFFSLLSSLLLAFPAAAHAQSAASVSGMVSDASGAVIPGAQVSLQNTSTNVTQSTQTNGAGTYAFVDVVPGKYLLKATKSGFAVVKETNIVLVVNQVGLFNLKMIPGSVQQTVTVSATPSTEQTTSATLGTVIATKSVNDLPLNGRNFTQMLELTPGVSRISVALNSTGGESGTPIGQFTFPAVNGQRNRANMFLLDGANDNGTYESTYNYEPIIDDIQEFKVQSHSDLAEFGEVTGGIVNVVTKSGTNQFHGSLWEFIRNSAFDARNYFATKVNPLRQNQFGGAVGGPVWIPHLYNGRDRTFFFFAYEGFRESQAAQTLLTTQTPAQLAGDFSSLLAKGVVIYNPFSTTPDPNKPGQYLRTPFPNNQIPSSLLSPLALAYAKALFPAPAFTGNPAGNVYDDQPLSSISNSFTGRVDQAIGRHDFVYGRASAFNYPYTSSGSVPGIVETHTSSGYNVTAHEVHTFGATSTLEAYFTRNVGTLTSDLSYSSPTPALAQTLIGAGFSSAFLNGYPSPSGINIPGIAVTGYLTVPSVGYMSVSNSDQYEYGGSFSKIYGRHTFKAGGVLSTVNNSVPNSTSTETTSTFQTSNLEQPTSSSGAATGDAMASFLLGTPTSATRVSRVSVGHGGVVGGAYFQDQIHLTPHFAINLGVRWDVTVWPVVAYLSNGMEGYYFGNMNLLNGTYTLAALPPACSTTVEAPCIPGGVLPANVVVTPNKNHSLHNTDYSNWQGRVSFAYQARPTTFIHAGYGRVYDEWSYVSQQSLSWGGNWPSVSSIVQPSLNSTTPTVTIGDPVGTAESTPPATPFNSASTYRNPSMLTPYSDQWNLGIDQAIRANTVFTLAYVGSHSLRIDLGGLSNTAEYPAPGTAAQVASRRQWPYIVPTSFDNSTGNSNYNALQTTLNKRTSNGLTYLLSYTWSKSIDLACSGSGAVEGCLLQNPYDPQADRSVSGYDLTHIFSGSVVYELPFGVGRQYKSSHALVNAALGGWQLNTITSFSSGTPYSVTVDGDIANVGNTFVQANLVGNPTPQKRGPNEWINPSAFSAPPAYTFGTFGRNALRSNWFRDVDLSAFKDFALPESTNLEFRAEAFNVTNSVVFGAPGSVVGTPTFGVVSATGNTERELQFALKVQF